MQASVQSDDREDPTSVPCNPSVNKIIYQLFKAAIQSAKVTCHSRRATGNNALCVSDDFSKIESSLYLERLPHDRVRALPPSTTARKKKKKRQTVSTLIADL